MNILKIEKAWSSKNYLQTVRVLVGVGRDTQPQAWSHLVLQLPLHAFSDSYGNQTEDVASGNTECTNWEWISLPTGSILIWERRQARFSLTLSTPLAVTNSQFFNPGSHLESNALWIFWGFPKSWLFYPWKISKGTRRHGKHFFYTLLTFLY